MTMSYDLLLEESYLRAGSQSLSVFSPNASRVSHWVAHASLYLRKRWGIPSTVLSTTDWLESSYPHLCMLCVLRIAWRRAECSRGIGLSGWHLGRRRCRQELRWRRKASWSGVACHWCHRLLHTAQHWRNLPNELKFLVLWRPYTVGCPIRLSYCLGLSSFIDYRTTRTALQDLLLTNILGRNHRNRRDSSWWNLLRDTYWTSSRCPPERQDDCSCQLWWRTVRECLHPMRDQPQQFFWPAGLAYRSNAPCICIRSRHANEHCLLHGKREASVKNLGSVKARITSLNKKLYKVILTYC